MARFILLWEVFWRAFWLFPTVLALFLAVAFSDVLPGLPGWLHAVVLAGFVGLTAYSLYWGFKRFQRPSQKAALRRLEQDSGLAHRPLDSLSDRLATDSRDAGSVGLWKAHQNRMLAATKKLRLNAPRPDLTAADPHALRLAAMLLLGLALLAGHHDWQDRLTAALTPQVAVAEALPPARLDAWINPPAYTGQPPLLLESTETEAIITVPQGSELLAQVQGGTGLPKLTLGEASVDFEELSSGAYRLTQALDGGEWFAVSQSGKTLGTWALDLVPDTAPTVEYFQPPSRTERSILRVEYDAYDDYGVESVEAVLKRIDQPDADPLVLELPLPSSGGTAVRSASYHDLTPHPWAGIAVEMTLVARDALGQEGRSEALRTVIPERIFNHPVARALAELRKQLTLNPNDRRKVVAGLTILNREPAHYFHDVVVFLAIRTAERRLLHDRSETAIADVQQLLWDTALHIEDGELALAERELRELQEELMRALAEGASDEEIERLMDELSEALDRFLEALAEQMSEQLAQGLEPQPLPEGAEIISSSDLQEMLERAREMARNGARDAAQQMLAQLQEMLENMRRNPMAQGMQGENQQAWEMLRELEDLVLGQQDVMDRTFQRSQQGQFNQGQPQPGQDPGQRGQGNPEDLSDAQAQEALRQRLGELMRRLAESFGDIPKPLGRAEQAMRSARDALQGSRPGEALDPQGRALDQLQQGMQAMAESILERMGQNQAQGGTGPIGGPGQQGRDPLGRNSGDGGFEALEGVEIPDEMELRRAGEILDELRRRRGQRQRPADELDYIDRLLRQF